MTKNRHPAHAKSQHNCQSGRRERRSTQHSWEALLLSKGRASKIAKENSELNRKWNIGQVWWSNLQYVESEAERFLVLGQPRKESKILSKRKEEMGNLTRMHITKKV